jgi:pimeloyl-ACP methyl ester carboxylesterase
MVRRRSRAVIFVVTAVCATALVLGAAFLLTWRKDIPLDTLRARYTNANSHFVEVDAMQVHYRDEGAGPVVVLLHGTSSSLHTWDGWSAALSKNHRIVRLDLPAFGLTGPNPSRDYSLDAYVAFLDHFASQMGLARFTLGGNSLGGAIAWNYAITHKARVHALVLVDAAGYLLAGSGLPLAFRMATWPLIPSLLVHIDPRHLVEDGVRRCYGDPSRIRPDILERYYELALRPGNREAFIDRMRVPRVDSTSLIREITTPTLVLWGARDRLIPVEAAHRFAGDIGGSRLVVYDDLGHIPMEEGPERTAADVERFLSELPAE